MIFLIHLTIFASDNYQGGSGKFFKTKLKLNISSDMSLDFANREIKLAVENYKLNNCPFHCDSKIIITKIEII